MKRQAIFVYELLGSRRVIATESNRFVLKTAPNSILTIPTVLNSIFSKILFANESDEWVFGTGYTHV
jgi:hypothetical protein